jgi:hypothetical protein
VTVTTWSTSAEIPPAAWGALLADLRTLLAVAASGGATVTDPDGTGEPVLAADRVAFTVDTADGPPLTVEFPRVPSTGTATTTSTATSGLVLAALARTARHLGSLFAYETDADTPARAFAAALADALFADDDRAVAGTPPPGVTALAEAVLATIRAHLADAPPANLLDYLDAVAAELAAELAGRRAAASLTAPIEETP